MSIYYALLLPQHVRLKILEIRRVLFSKSGHPSFRSQESCILLGQTEDTTLTKNVTCPPLPLKVQARATFSADTLHFPVEKQTLASLRAELGVSHPYSGIYLGRKNMEYEGEIPPLNNLRLALVEVKEEGAITLWRTIAEKRLQKDKGI
ncbi:MAG: hypothetical protein EOM68_15405 [Spirochaetia bacterium]|nr:hypothetical protein [Spirochaetia bacterium]